MDFLHKKLQYFAVLCNILPKFNSRLLYIYNKTAQKNHKYNFGAMD